MTTRLTDKKNNGKEVFQPKAIPSLHVDGRFLKDQEGNTVTLHGVAMTPNPWYNGCAQQGFIWKNDDYQACLAYNCGLMDKLSNPSEGWYLDYVRLHIDPYLTHRHGSAQVLYSYLGFDFYRFAQAIEEVILPLVEHAESKGMYVVLRPPVDCPFRIVPGDQYQVHLARVWSYLAAHPRIGNSVNVMFELAHEPVTIRGTNGQWGNDSREHYDALKQYFQPIVNTIRETGSNNILWVPGLAWQSNFRGLADNLVEGEGIGYAAHVYPGFWKGNNNNPDILKANWNHHIQPIADKAPLMVTEIEWAPTRYGLWGNGGMTGTVGQWGFGANFKYLVDQSGNVSWNVSSPENLIDKGELDGGIAYEGDPEACALPVSQWFKAYSMSGSSYRRHI